MSMLNRKTFFIREHAGMFKLSNTYDILDPETQEQVGVAKEKPGFLMHVLRFVWDKDKLPTTVFVYEGSDPDDEQKLLFSIKRKPSLFISKVSVHDSSGSVLGSFMSKLWGIGIRLRVLDAAGRDVALVKGDWKGWNFSFLDTSENEIGTITKKWSGVGKELFTSADNYFVALNDKPDPAIATLLLGAGLAVDTLYSEN